MPQLDVNGTTLYYEDTGPPPGPNATGETIVFSHGLLWSTEQFAPQVAALRTRYRCISWDHRGQGQSAPDASRNTIGIELVWQDAVALLEKLETGPVHFCGLSMGGFVAMRTASRRPDLVRSLLLLETSADPEPTENVPRYRMLVNVVRIGAIGLVRRRLGPIFLAKSTLSDPTRKADVERFTQIMIARKDAWRAANGVIDRAGIAIELPRINTPALVIVGDEDVATTPAKAQRLVAAIRGAKLVTIPRAGHSSSVEQPDAVTSAIDQFLGSIRTPARRSN
ncbi:MAG TPA: alpha/beta fold hydrolase [Kofleriaceae bacterium]